MLIKKLFLFLTTVSLIASMSLSPALAAATKSEVGQQISNDDARIIISDNAALMAEIEAVNQALASERKSTREIIDELNRYIKVSEEEKVLLKRQNEILLSARGVLEKQVRASKRQQRLNLLLGIIVGAAIGAAVN